MSSRHDWWKTFFQGLMIDFWRAAMSPEATRAEADFLERALAPPPGGEMLDVPCGNGRLSLELARRGFRMTGVDLSTEFLDAARSGSAARGLEIAWRRSDMRELPWQARFDGAFCAGSSFGYLGDEGDSAYLTAVNRALRPGARFVIDAVKAAEIVLPPPEEPRRMQLGDISFSGENRYDAAARWMDSRYTVCRGDRCEVAAAAFRVYTHAEVVAMLAAAGFEECESLGSLAGEPFAAGGSRLILVATKTRSRP